MTRRLDWVKLPTAWIERGGLKSIRWTKGDGADNTAALMVLIAIAHHADQETGLARLTYDTLAEATHLSRTKIAGGLGVLSACGLVVREPFGRSSFLLTDFDPANGWAKIPVRRLYSGGAIAAFAEMKLRRPAELHAMKLYLLFASRRGRDTNLANISYDKITEYTEMDRASIKAGISALVMMGLIYVEQVPSRTSEYGVSNGYRLACLEAYNHAGTRQRGSDLMGFS
jgi:predicted transcriptional regulator